jgi:hypothetical protein
LLLQGILLHHDRFAGIKEEVVRVFAESFPSSGVRKSDGQDHLSVGIRWKGHGDESNGNEHEPEEGYPDLKLEFYTDNDGQSPFSAIGRGRHISQNPLADSGLTTARNMIKQCLSSHSKCRHSKPSTLPRRVLDVLVEDGSKGIRLHETAYDRGQQCSELGEYLTLSHCWGVGNRVLQTTSETLQAHRENIPWSSLPKTFQDAVVLTRCLEFRWLWIDSLCIVQDDQNDCQIALSTVDDVFSNSFLTLAATSAADSSVGCLLPKPQPFKIQATDSRGTLNKIYVREQPSHYSFKAPFDEGAHMNDWELPFNTSAEANRHTPLLKRAWAYAERLLSPRVLHFTKSEMIMECREGYQCECGRIDDSRYDSRTTDTVKQEFAKIAWASEIHRETTNGLKHGIENVASQLGEINLGDVMGPADNVDRDDAIQLWSYIVTEYTARDLTYDTDRLVAISGIAKRFAKILKSGYIAGQWTSSILDLLWHPNDSARCRRPQVASENIPSWSWASVEGSPIFFDTASAIDLACTANFPGEKGRTVPWSPTGGQSLQISAPMATEVIFRVDNPNNFSLAKNGVYVDFTPDIVPPRGYDELVPGETLICILVSMTFRSSIIGLVLKASAVNPEIHRRVGRFECYECQKDAADELAEDAEDLFGHWFPEVSDMTELDVKPKRTFIVV